MQIHLTALNAKMTLDEEGLLGAEFDRMFSRNSPEAIEWAFQVWRERSAFFPAVSDVLSLLKEYERGRREQAELKAALDQRFLLEQGRQQGQVPDFAEVVRELKEVADKARPEHAERTRKFNAKLEMKRASLAASTLSLTPEQIEARREKERAEIRRYQDIEDQHDGMY